MGCSVFILLIWPFPPFFSYIFGFRVTPPPRAKGLKWVELSKKVLLCQYDRVGRWKLRSVSDQLKLAVNVYCQNDFITSLHFRKFLKITTLTLTSTSTTSTLPGIQSSKHDIGRKADKLPKNDTSLCPYAACRVLDRFEICIIKHINKH